MPKAQLQKSIDYIRAHSNDAGENTYVLALAANALAAFDAKDDSTLQVLQRLDKQRKDVPEWKAINFPSKATSLTYARGDGITVETTALTVLAMLKTGQFTNSVNKSMTYLIKTKQGKEGPWVWSLSSEDSPKTPKSPDFENWEPSNPSGNLPSHA